MNDFDSQWDDINIDDIDLDTTDDIDIEEKPSTVKQKVDSLTKKSDEEEYINKNFDKLLAPEQEKKWDNLNTDTKWSKIINAMEQSLKYRWEQNKDRLNYEKQNLESKIQTAKEKNSPTLSFLQTKLADINTKRQTLINEIQDNIYAIDFIKGRASGLINTPEKDVYYQEHPQELRNILVKGNYKYKPTTIA